MWNMDKNQIHPNMENFESQYHTFPTKRNFMIGRSRIILFQVYKMYTNFSSLSGGTYFALFKETAFDRI
jgi:hypothetical protein